MAMTFSSSIRTTITCSAAQRKPDPTAHNKTNKWWAPLFGFSSDPDYIANNNNSSTLRIGRARPEFRGCFTEEKARELRKKTAESSNFHDIMYHSSIASRLASDVYGEHER